MTNLNKKEQLHKLFIKKRIIKKCDYCNNAMEIIHWDGEQEHKLCSEHRDLWLEN